MSREQQDSQDHEKPECLTPGCKAESKTRGLCQRCYAAANTQVKRGNVTWEKLVELGLAKQSTREAGSRDLFNIALAQALRSEAEAKAGAQGSEQTGRQD